MKQLTFFLILLYSTTQTSMRCKTGLVSSYGLEPEPLAVYQPMLLCKDVSFKCCSYLDELKHHKLWKSYYQEKLDRSYEVVAKLAEKLQNFVGWANDMDITKLEPYAGETCKLADIKASVDKVGLKSLDSLTSDVGALKEMDSKIKEQFICFLCDAKNHLKVSELDKRIYVEEEVCKNLVSKGKKYMLTNLQLYSVIIALNELFSCLNIPNSTLKLDQGAVEELKGFVLNAEDCLKSGFKEATCSYLCSQYSIQDVSKTIVGNIELYRHVIANHQLIEVFLKQSEEYEKAIQAAQKPAKENKDKDKDSKDGKDDKNAKDEDKKDAKDGDKKDAKADDKKDAKAEDKKDPGADKDKKSRRKLKSQRILSEGGLGFKLAEIATDVNRYKRVIKKLKNKNKKMLIKIYGNHRQLNTAVGQSDPSYYDSMRYLQVGGVMGNLNQAQPVNPQPVVPQGVQPVGQPLQGYPNQPTQPGQPNYQVPSNQIPPVQPYPQGYPQPQQPLPVGYPNFQPQGVPFPNQQFPQQVQQQPQQQSQQEEPPMDLSKQQELKIKKQAKIDLYSAIYDKLMRGTPEDFKDLGWITNKFYEGSFLDNYRLAFGPNGAKLSYKFTDEYNKSKDDLLKKMSELERKGPKKISKLTSPNTTIYVNSVVDQISMSIVFEFNFDSEIYIGGTDPTSGTAEEKSQTLKKVKQIMKKKKEEEKMKADEKKKTEEKKEGDKPGDKEKDTAKEEKKARLLKKMKELKEQLTQIHTKSGKAKESKSHTKVKSSRKLKV